MAELQHNASKHYLLSYFNAMCEQLQPIFRRQEKRLI